MMPDLMIFNFAALRFGEVIFLILSIFIFLLTCFYTIMKIGGSRQLRYSVIERHSARLRAESMRRTRGASNIDLVRSLGSIQSIVTSLLPRQWVHEKRRFLRSAGFSGDIAWQLFVFVKISTLLLIFISLFVYMFAEYFSEVDDQFFVIFLVVSIGSFLSIDIFFNQRRKGRLRRLERSLPDGLDLLVICAEAGLSLDAGLKRVAEEFVVAVPELAEELFLTSVELNFLPQRRQALANLSQRVDIPAFRGVTTALIQTEKYGTPLANALRVLASEFRDTRLIQAEEKAARLPAILTVPMICFILPALFIVLAGPALISVLEKIGS